MGHFHHSLFCRKAIHIPFHSFIDLDTWRGKYILMKGGSEAIFGVVFQTHRYSKLWRWNKQHTDLDFLPGTKIHVGGTAIPATSLPQGGTIRRRKHSEWKGAKGDMHVFSKNNSTLLQAGLYKCSEAASFFPLIFIAIAVIPIGLC